MNLPEDFEIDEPKSSIGNLPEGFVLDETPWSDVPKNAAQDVKDIGKGVLGMGKSLATAPIDIPSSVYQTGKGMIQGKSFSETPLGEQANALKEIPGRVFERAKEIVEDPIESFKKNPVKTPLDVASVVMPTAKALGLGKTAEEMNLLQEIGGRNINKSMGLKYKTISNMAKSENPAEFGSKLGAELNREGAVGFTAGGTWKKANNLKRQYGVEVGNAIDNIKNSGFPTTIPADEALSSLSQESQRLLSSPESSNRIVGKMYKNRYEFLKQKSEASGGQLSLDDIRDAMEDVGEAINNTAKEGTKREGLLGLYGHLADARDTIVSRVAEQADNPALREDLMNANKGFSKYSRVMPDIKKRAAMEGVGHIPGEGEFSLTKPASYLPGMAKTAVAKGFLKAGDLIEVVQRSPQVFGKFAPLLMSVASRGIPAFNAATYVLQQRDPEFNSLMNKIKGNDENDGTDGF